MAIQQSYVDMDFNRQKLVGYLENPMTSVARIALTLTAADSGYVAYDTTELRAYQWTGSAWVGAFNNPMATLGDLVSGGASGVAGRLGIGLVGQVLTVASGVPSWVTPVSGTSGVQTLTYAAAQTWNVAISDSAALTLTANMTSLTISNAVAGRRYSLMITQGAGGSKTGAYGASFKWPGGTVTALTLTAAKSDLLVFYYDGSFFYASMTKNY